MTLAEAVVKLEALRISVDRYMSSYQRGMIPLHTVHHMFEQFAECSTGLRAQEAELLAGLPDSSRMISPSEEVLINGVQYINPSLMSRLSADIEHAYHIVQALTSGGGKEVRVNQQGVFLQGQQFDALMFAKEILEAARESILIVDGYIDENVLVLLTGKQPGVSVKLLTKARSVNTKFKVDAVAFSSQSGDLAIRMSDAFHDRFVIIDDRDFYHFGASIKDLGKRAFMFSRIQEPVVVDRLRTAVNKEWSKAKDALGGDSTE